MSPSARCPTVPFVAIAVAVAAAAAASAQPDPRPSVLLVVVDTLRADAVSAYGGPAGTTPAMDAAAADGILYERVYAPAPWTIPSHATLFSGLDVDRHRFGLDGSGSLSDEVVTLAERLAAAGYSTAAFSENIMLSEPFQLLRGFEHRRTTDLSPTSGIVWLDAGEGLDEYLQVAEPEAPLFVFANLLDPHSPYEIRDHNPYVPPGTPEDEIARRRRQPNRALCGGRPSEREIQVLHGLYLGDVQEADRKLRRLQSLMREAVGEGPLITVITSDHGEYFGEENLMGHEFGLHEAVLRVPLIVHGLPGAEPGRVAETVGLVDLAPSILAWAGVQAGEELSGRPLPLAAGSQGEGRSYFAAYSDRMYGVPELWQRHAEMFDRDVLRQFCTPQDRVWGGMAALIRHPFVLRWYEQYPDQLFDLSWDAEQRSDQAPYRAELVEELTARIAPRVAEAFRPAEPGEGEGLTPEGVEALRALGYVE